MANPWFRLYSRIITDPKIEFLSFEDQRHFVWVLCLKNEGFLDEDFEIPEMRERMIARKLGVQGEAFESVKQRLLEMKLISDDWQPISWDELQFKSDSSKERTRKYRERLKKNKSVTERDVTVTAQDTEQIQNRTEIGQPEHRSKLYPPEDFYPNDIIKKQISKFRNLDLEAILDKFKSIEFQEPTSWDKRFYSFVIDNHSDFQKSTSTGMQDL